MELKATLKDYTEPEFQALVNRIWAVDLPKQDHDQLINHFDRIVGHPKGADLFFYPDDQFNTNSAGSVVFLVQNWHRKRGMTAFKNENVSVSPPPVQLNPAARSLAEVQKIAADVSVSERAVETAFGIFELGIKRLRSLRDFVRISLSRTRISALWNVLSTKHSWRSEISNSGKCAWSSSKAELNATSPMPGPSKHSGRASCTRSTQRTTGTLRDRPALPSTIAFCMMRPKCY